MTRILIIALALIAIYLWLQSGLIPNSNITDRNIVITKPVIQQILLEAKITVPKDVDPVGYFQSLDEATQQSLINRFVQEEALYREALALGLDKDDMFIKRRLVQRLMAILENFHSNNVNISKEDVTHDEIEKNNKHVVDKLINKYKVIQAYESEQSK